MNMKRSRLTGVSAVALTIVLISGCGLQAQPGTNPTTVPTTGPAATTSIRTSPVTTPQTTSLTAPVTLPVTLPQTMPVTKPATIPATKPATIPTTKPVTKPTTQPTTTSTTTVPPETKPASTGAYMDLSNERFEWSYGYPDKWVTNYSGHWKFSDGKLYLTFDLGYETGYSDEILDALAAAGVRAAFFLTTEYIREHPATVRRMLDEGHQIGNHSTKHINMVRLSENGAEDLITNTRLWEKAYQDATGETSHLYRAPEGVFSRRGLAILEDLGYDTYFWGAAYADYDEANQPSLEVAKEKLYKYVSSGDVILLHPFSTNAALLPTFIADMQAQGYQFAPLP